jgi:hypothetical protein
VLYHLPVIRGKVISEATEAEVIVFTDIGESNWHSTWLYRFSYTTTKTLRRCKTPGLGFL